MENVHTKELKYFSMFSGIGGFELGIQNSFLQQGEQEELSREDRDNLSHKERQHIQCSETSIRKSAAICIGYSEIDKYAIQIYEKHFKGHENYGDCKRICWNDVQRFDLLVGGFPCQAFSVAGKRGGFTDTRGTLFFEIARCLREKQPRLFLLENVKGLLSHNKGQTFATILATLDELGYDCQWQVLNSKNFGVPQNRERVFIVGHFRGTSRPEVFPIGEANSPADRSVRRKIGKLPCVVRKDGGLTLERLGMCVLSNPHGFNKGSIKEKPTLRACNNYAANEPLVHKGKIRRLTPTECERLQSFPDGWTEGISDTQRYKCLGNAVTVNVIEAIMEKLF